MILASIALGGVLVLLIVLAVIGVFAWCLTTYVPMPAPIRGIIIVIAVIVALLIVLNAFGLLDSTTSLRIDR